MGHLPKYTGCTNCGDEPMQVQTYPQTNCKDENLQDPCVSQKGKFHDKITEDFIVPQSSNQAKMFVCDGSLWAKSQWVALENGADKIAVYPIMATGNKTITIMNGCRSGEDIFGNPDPGKSFPKGTVIFPVPPSGCDSNFCERVAEAIRTCGAEGVYDLLKESEELCFTSVPVLGETEKGHIFAGTMPDNVTEQDPESPWRSCLRKLSKIWSNLGGRTLCFADLPLYDKINDPSKIARSVVSDQNGCLAKGESVYSCESEDAVPEGEGADAILVCKDSQRSILLPECDSIIVGCCDQDDENPEWKVRKKGLNLHLLSTPVEIYKVAMYEFGSGAIPTAVALNDVLATVPMFNPILDEACNGKVWAYVDFFMRVGDSTTGSNPNLDVYYNNVPYRKIYSDSSDRNDSYFVDIVPMQGVFQNTLKFELKKIAGNGNMRILVRVLGFYL